MMTFFFRLHAFEKMIGEKNATDLLFQVISLRYEQGALAITSNRAFKDWPEIFNNDNTLTSAILDWLLHHAETVLILGKSYRMYHFHLPLQSGPVPLSTVKHEQQTHCHCRQRRRLSQRGSGGATAEPIKPPQ